MVDETIPDEISCIYAAKQMAQYLNIVHRLEPQQIQGTKRRQTLTDRVLNTIKDMLPDNPTKTREKEDMESARKIQEYHLRKAGIKTEEERGALTVAKFAAVYLRKEVRDSYDSSISLTGEMMHEHIKNAVSYGISALNGEYWLNMKDMPEIVNPEFEGKAREWLMTEIESRKREGSFSLLEAVTVRHSDDGRFIVKPYERQITAMKRTGPAQENISSIK